MWVNGGKHYQFMMGRDYERRARFVIAIHFGWRGDVPQGETMWKHCWGFSTARFEGRLKRLRQWWKQR